SYHISCRECQRYTRLAQTYHQRRASTKAAHAACHGKTSTEEANVLRCIKKARALAFGKTPLAEPDRVKSEVHRNRYLHMSAILCRHKQRKTWASRSHGAEKLTACRLSRVSQNTNDPPTYGSTPQYIRPKLNRSHNSETLTRHHD
ncbi:unnamed protein product, partial [Ectocarpus sp. 13 AM-2016]